MVTDYREKDGYTVEMLDIYGIDSNGRENVILHQVSWSVSTLD